MRYLRRFLGCSALGIAWMTLGACLATATQGCGVHESCGMPPEITSPEATEIGEHRATLSATINPGDLATRYKIWIKYDECENSGSECVARKTEVVHRGRVGPAQTVTKSVKVDVTPGCHYEFWFEASNSLGSVETRPESFRTPKKSKKQGPACSR